MCPRLKKFLPVGEMFCRPSMFSSGYLFLSPIAMKPHKHALLHHRNVLHKKHLGYRPAVRFITE